jgi:hypothetical protein
MMDFKELDDKTRHYMLEEFQKEEKSGNPYRSKRLTALGLEKFPTLMEKTIKSGNELTLEADLNNKSYWKSSEISHSKGTAFSKDVPSDAAKTLALSEFSTWYTRGLSKKFIDEGQQECEIYRAQSTEDPRCSCSKLEGHRFKVKEVYDGHRAKYHPVANYSAFSIPSGPNCHHTIRRV